MEKQPVGCNWLVHVASFKTSQAKQTARLTQRSPAALRAAAPLSLLLFFSGLSHLHRHLYPRILKLCIRLLSFFSFFFFAAGFKRPETDSRGQVGAGTAIPAFARGVTRELAQEWLPMVVEGLICLLRNSLRKRKKASQKCLGPAGMAALALG